MHRAEWTGLNEMDSAEQGEVNESKPAGRQKGQKHMTRAECRAPQGNEISGVTRGVIGR